MTFSSRGDGRGSCHECGSYDITKDLRLVICAEGSTRNEVKMEIDENPESIGNDDINRVVLKANVCESCGNIMLVVSKSDAYKAKIGQLKIKKRRMRKHDKQTD